VLLPDECRQGYEYFLGLGCNDLALPKLKNGTPKLSLFRVAISGALQQENVLWC
jgi:hypothetical protein